MRHVVSRLLALSLLSAGPPMAAQVTSIGLSSVRAQRFGNEDLVGFDPLTGDRFAWALAVGDFNGDGADDLATGIPFDDGITGIELADCGGGVIRYGLPGLGLYAGVANQFLRQTPDRDPAEEGDLFGWALAACDFNGDGFDDLAVGVPGEHYGGDFWAGAVNIYYGAANGLHNLADAFYTQSTAGIPGDVEESDFFGSALACGDFDANGFDDLAIGVPLESLDVGEGANGMVDIVPGSASGLDPGSAYSFDQDSPGIPGEPEGADGFGDTLAAGDFDADGFDDLAIGATGEDDNGGAVHVLFGDLDGLRGPGSLFLNETGIGGLSEDGDGFGEALAAGDFDGDGFDDLAIGIPFEDFGPGGSVPDTGQVNVVYGALGGFDLGHTQYWAHDNILGAGTSESNDKFGFAMAAGDFDRDGHDDLAVGSPGEFVTGPNDGAATVWMGSAAGLTSSRHRGIAAGFDGFPGSSTQHHKDFGSSLAAGDFDGDGHADLAIGAPYEDANGLGDVGTATVLYGALFADGFETAATDLWSATPP
jgi:hypothetical protein